MRGLWAAVLSAALAGLLYTGAAFALSGGAAARVSACPHARTPVSRSSKRTMRAAVLCLVNQERRRFHLPPLHENGRLERAAQQHTDDMVSHDYFSHDTPSGRTPFQRIAAAGYHGSYEGENIGAGYPTPVELLGALMSDVGHCQNILFPEYHDIGIGVSSGAIRAYHTAPGTWTQDFGLRAGAKPASTNSKPAHGCPHGI